MPLSRLENFIKNVEGNILYVNPSDLDATDSIENQGNSLTRPFKTIQRALIEAARFSYQVGPDNDKFDKTTVLVYPGIHKIDNRPGYSIHKNGNAAQYKNRNGSVISFGELTGSSNFDIEDPENVLHVFNGVNGGVIIPRGTSLVGMDLRKTKIFPMFVPDPENSEIDSTGLFKITGGCYFWQFSIFDGDPNGQVYKNYTSSKFTPNFSHHKLTVFEYADGRNPIELTAPTGGSDVTSTLTDLDTYYFKIANAFGNSSGRAITNWPVNNDIEPKLAENQIVGAIQADSVGITSVYSTSNTTTYDATGATGKYIVITTAVEHNLAVGTPIILSGITTSSTSISDDPIFNAEGGTLVSDVINEKKFVFTASAKAPIVYPHLSGDESFQVEPDTVTGASPYIFNCSLRSVYGLNGLHADGNKATGFKSMVLAQYTGIGLQKDDNAFLFYDESTGSYKNNNNVDETEKPLHINSKCIYKPEYESTHVKVTNSSILQCVSIFAIGFANHFVADTGGDQSITNSNSNFGAKALIARGFRNLAFNRDDSGYITHVIPPKETTSIEENSFWVPLNVGLSTSTSVGYGYSDRLYAFGYTDIDSPPTHIIDSYRIGARENDLIKLELFGETKTAKVLMDGSLTATTEKVSKVTKTGSGNSITSASGTIGLDGNHEFEDGETIRIFSDNGIYPDGLEGEQIYYVIKTGVNANQIKVAKTFNQAIAGTPLTGINNKGGKLTIVSRVSDKLPGDAGHPIQYDSSSNNWYVGVESGTSNTIYTGLFDLEKNVTSKTFISRKPDGRNLDDRVYKLRYVIPKEFSNAKPPSAGYVIQESKSTIVANSAEYGGTIQDLTDFRNVRIIHNAIYDSAVGIATITSEKPHGLLTESSVKLNNIRSTSNATGVGNSGFNGIFEVQSIVDSKKFTINLPSTRAPGTYVPIRPAVESDRDENQPNFSINKFRNTFYIYRINTIKEYISGKQDGIYHLICLDGSVTPTASQFSSRRFSQNVVNLYPQLDRDNYNSDPKSAISVAQNYAISKVTTDDLRHSITKEFLNNFLLDNRLGFEITNAEYNSSTGIATFTTNIQHGLDSIRSVSIASSGAGYGYADLVGVAGTTIYNATLTGGSGEGMTITFTVNNDSNFGVITPTIVDGGSGYEIGDTLTLSAVGIPTFTDAGNGITYSQASFTVSSIYKSVNNPLQISNVVDFGTNADDFNGIKRITGVPSSKKVEVLLGRNITSIGTFKDYDNGLFNVTGKSAEISTIQYTDVKTGIVTVTCATPHGLNLGNKFVIDYKSTANANDSDYSGTYTVLERIGINTFTFNIGENVSLISTPTNTGYILPAGYTSQEADSDESQENTERRMVPFRVGISTTLNGSLTKSSSSISLLNARGFEKGDYVEIGPEIIRITTDFTSNTASIIRGLFGTKRSVIADGSLVKKIKPIPCEGRRYSILRASGHTFEYVGFGPGNYSNALPQRQDRNLSKEEQLLTQSEKSDGGVVVYTGMNDSGDFYVGNRRLSSATGQEETIGIPIPTYVGDDTAGTRLSVVFDDVTVKENIKVEGGASNIIQSEFNGPVLFTNKIISNSDKGADFKFITLKGTTTGDPSTTQRRITVGISTPSAEADNSIGDVVFKNNPEPGGYLGWVFAGEEGTENTAWRKFGLIATEDAEQEEILGTDSTTNSPLGNFTILPSKVGINTNIPKSVFEIVDGTARLDQLSVAGLATFYAPVTLASLEVADAVITNKLESRGLVSFDANRGFNVSGNTVITGLTTFTGNSDLNGNLEISGTTSIGGATNITNTLTVSGHTDLNRGLNVSGNTSLNGTLVTKGNASFASRLDVKGNTSLGGTLTVCGNTDLNGTLNVSGATNITNTLTVSGHTDLNRGLNVSGNTSLRGTLRTTGNASFASRLDVKGNTSLGGTLTVCGNTDLNGTLNVSGNTDIDGTLDVSGATNITNTLTVSGHTDLNRDLNVSGNTDIDGTLDVSGATNITNTLTVSGNTDLNRNLGVSGNTSLHGTLVTKGAASFASTLNVKGNTSVGGTLTVSGATNITNTLTVSGNTDLNRNLGVSGNTSLNGTLVTKGNASFASRLDVKGNTSLGGTLTVSGHTDLNRNLGVSGNTSLHGTLVTKGAASFASRLDVKGNTCLGGTLTVKGLASFDQDITVCGNTLYTGSLSVSGNACAGGTLDVGGNTCLGGTLTVKGLASFDQDITVCGNTLYTGSLSVSGNTSLGGTLDVGGSTCLGGTLTVSGATNITNTLTVSGNTDLNRNLGVSGNTSLRGTLIVKNTTTLSGVVTLCSKLNANDISSSGVLRVDNNVSFHKNLVVSGNIKSKNTVSSTTLNVSGKATAGNLHVTGNVSVDTNLHVAGTTCIGGKLEAKSTVSVGGNFFTSGSINVKNNISMGGTLKVEVDAGQTTNIINATMAANDGFRLRMGGGTNSGYVAFDLKDDGTDSNVGERFLFRKYSGNYQNVCSTLTLLDRDGNTQIPGNLQVNGTLSAKGNAVVCGTLGVSGKITGKNGLDIRGNTSLNGNVYVSGTVCVTDNIHATGIISASELRSTLIIASGQTICADNDVIAEDNVTAKTGNLTAGGNLYVSGFSQLGGEIKAGGNISAAGKINVRSSDSKIFGLTISSNGLDVLNKDNAIRFKPSGTVPTSILRNDGSNWYFLYSDDAAGLAGFNDYRPLRIRFSDGRLFSQNGQTLKGGQEFYDGTVVKGTLTVSGHTDLNRDLNVSGNTSLHGTLVTKGAASFASTLNVKGNTSVGGTLTVSGNTDLNRNLGVSGNTSLRGTLIVKGSTTLSGVVTICNKLHANDISASGKIIASGHICADRDLFVSGNIKGDGNLNVVGKTSTGSLRSEGTACMDNELHVKGGIQLHSGTISMGVAAGSNRDLLYGLIANSDFYRIRIGGSNDTGYLAFDVGDNGRNDTVGEQIVFRKFGGSIQNPFQNVCATLTLLDRAGNTQIPLNLQVNGTLSAKGNAVVSGTLGVNKKITTSGLYSSKEICTDARLHALSVSIGQGLTVSGTASVEGNLYLGGTLFISSSTSSAIHSVNTPNLVAWKPSGTVPTSIIRNDGSNWWFLYSDAAAGFNDSWNDYRPLRIRFSDGRLFSTNGQTFTGGQAFAGGTTIGNGLTVCANATICGDLITKNTGTFKDLTIGRNAFISGDLQVSGNVNFKKGLGVSATLSVGGEIRASSSISAVGDIKTRGSLMTVSSANAILIKNTGNTKTSIIRTDGIKLYFLQSDNSSDICGTWNDSFFPLSIGLSNDPNTSTNRGRLYSYNGQEFSGGQVFSGEATINDGLKVVADANVCGKLTAGAISVSGSSTFKGAITGKSGLTLNGGLVVKEGATLSSGVTMKSSATIKGALTVCSTVLVTGVVTLKNHLNTNGDVNIGNGKAFTVTKDNLAGAGNRRSILGYRNLELKTNTAGENSFIEIKGGNPYIDLARDVGTDYHARFQVVRDNGLMSSYSVSSSLQVHGAVLHATRGLQIEGSLVCAGGSAPSYLCRAYGRITGQTTFSGGNIRSVAHSGSVTTVCFTTNMSGDYSVVCTLGSDDDHVIEVFEKKPGRFKTKNSDPGQGNNTSGGFSQFEFAVFGGT